MSIAEKLRLEVLLAAIDKVTGPLKTITKGSGDAARALRAAKDQLKDIEGQQKAIAAFKDADKAAAITANAFKGVQEQVKHLQREMAKTPEPTRAMIKALKDAQAESDTLKNRHASLMDRQQRLFAQMKEGGIDTRNLANHSRDLATRQIEAARGVDKLKQSLEAQNKVLARMHAARANYDKSMAAAGKLRNAGTKALGVGAAINAAAAVPVIAYAKAEDAATQLKVAMLQKGGQISADFEKINALAGKLGNRLPGTTADFQDMMTMLIRQGMPSKALLGGLGEATAYLAVQLKMAPTAAAEFSSKLQDATRTADKDMMGLMDTIQRMFYLGVDSNNMLEAFKGLGPAMDIIKRKGLEGANALAPFVVMMDQAGMRGEAAGGAIRKVISKSLDVDKIKKVTDDLMKEKGVRLKLDFTDGKGEFGGIERMMGELAKLKNFSTVQRMSILKDLYGDDKENNEVLSKIIEKGMDGYRDVQRRMAEQAEIQERVKLQLGTLRNLWDAATGTFTNALVAFGEAISPELHATAEWLGTVAEATQRWAKENPGLAAGLMHVVKWAGMAALGIGVIMVAVAGIIGPFAIFKYGLAWIATNGTSVLVAIKAIGSGLLWVGRMLLANPLGIAVTLLATAAFLIYKNWEPIKMFFSVLWDDIKAVTSATVDWFMALPSRFMAAGAAIVDGIMSGITSKWEALKSLVTGLADSTVGWLKDKLGIRSPSAVFAEIGGYTMEGLEQGILRGQDGPLAALARAAKGIVSAGAGVLVAGGAMAGSIDTRPPIAPGGFGGGGGSMIVQITINPSPGMDEQALAREVARQIQQLESGNAARRRSRLVDSE